MRDARIACDLTQQEAAEGLRIKQSTISRIETGERKLDVTELKALAELYGKPASWFLDRPGGPDRETIKVRVVKPRRRQ